MSYRIISMRGDRYGRKSEADEFFHAAEKARAAVEEMHDLACEMEERYGERYFGERGRYGMRDHEMWDDDMPYAERRRRDARGRYM